MTNAILILFEVMVGMLMLAVLVWLLGLGVDLLGPLLA
jgi:hypothetical protein